jgi:hypothetical protein
MSLSNLISILFCIGIASSALGALYQPTSLGYLAASPGVLLIAFTLLFLPLCRLSLIGRSTLLLLGWGLVVSFVSLVIYGYSPTYVSKMGALFVLSSIWLAPLIWGERINLHHLRLGLLGALIICFIGLLAIDFFPLNQFRDIFFGENFRIVEHRRVRGFMQETSHFAHIIGHAFFLLYLISRSGRPVLYHDLLVCLMLLAVLLGLIASRGSAMSVLMALLIATLNRRSAFYLLMITPFIYWAGGEVAKSIIYDIDNFTSTATRSTLLLTSLDAFFHNPLGYGYYGFYGALQQFGRIAIEFVSGQTSFVTTELLDIVEELNNVSTKTTVFDFGLVFGLPFFALIWQIVTRINLADVRARAALVYFFLSALTTNGHQSIFFFLGLTVLMRLYPSEMLYAVRRQNVAKLKNG